MTPPLHTPDRKGKVARPSKYKMLYEFIEDIKKCSKEYEELNSKEPKRYYASIDSSVTINNKCAYTVFEVVLGDYVVVEQGYIDCYKYYTDKMKTIEAMCNKLIDKFGDGLNIIST